MEEEEKRIPADEPMLREIRITVLRDLLFQMKRE